MTRSKIEQTLYDEIRKRVERDLRTLWTTLGPLNREELGALMDGAQDAVMEWTPKRTTTKDA